MQTKKPECVIRGTGTPERSTTTDNELITGVDLVLAMTKLGLTVGKLAELAHVSSKTVTRALHPNSDVCSGYLMRITKALKDYQKIECDNKEVFKAHQKELFERLKNQTPNAKKSEEDSKPNLTPEKPNLIPELTEAEKYAVVKALFERRKEEGFSKKDVKKVEEWATKAKSMKTMFEAVIDGQAVVDIVNDEVAIMKNEKSI